MNKTRKGRPQPPETGASIKFTGEDRTTIDWPDTTKPVRLSSTPQRTPSAPSSFHPWQPRAPSPEMPPQVFGARSSGVASIALVRAAPGRVRGMPPRRRGRRHVLQPRRHGVARASRAAGPGVHRRRLLAPVRAPLVPPMRLTPNLVGIRNPKLVRK